MTTACERGCLKVFVMSGPRPQEVSGGAEAHFHSDPTTVLELPCQSMTSLDKKKNVFPVCRLSTKIAFFSDKTCYF